MVIAILRIGQAVFRADTPAMHNTSFRARTHKVSREIDFEIGDEVYLIANPQWVGVVVARSLSADINVMWENHGVEQVDRRLLMLLNR